VQLFRQAKKANSRAVLHLPDEEDPGRLGAGEDGMPGYSVARHAEQQVLELEEGIVVFRAK